MSASPAAAGVRDRLELALERWGHWVYRNATLVLLAVLAAFVANATNLRHVRVDTTTEAFLREDDPVRVAYQAFRDEFGMDERVVVAIESEGVFDFVFLEKLRALHSDLESEVPHISAVDSLLNARDTRGLGDELIVEDLFEVWPESDAELAALKERALANPLYTDLLLSADAKLTVLMLELDTYSSLGEASDDAALEGFDDDAGGGDGEAPQYLSGEEMTSAVAAVEQIAARYQGDGFRIHLAGSPVLSRKFQVSMASNMSKFTIAGIVTIGFFLAVLFRRVVAVALPLLVSLMSLVTTFGIVGWMGVDFSVLAVILPSFLLAVGVGGTVHILVILQQDLARGSSKEDALAYALRHSGLPVIMTSLTTAAGLTSFAAATMVPAAQLGLLGPIGILVALVLTFTLGPALIAKLPMRADASDPREATSARWLARIGAWSVDHAASVVAVSAALIGVCLLGAATLQLSHNPMEWYPEDDPFRIANETVNDRMSGSVFLELIADTGQENGLYDPALLAHFDELRIDFAGMHHRDVTVGKSLSLADVVKEIHQALNANDPTQRAIPGDRELIAQELLLFENSGSDDLADFVDSQFSKGRMTLKLPFRDALAYAVFIDKVEERAREVLGAGVDVTTTGIIGLLSRIFNAMLETLLRSYLLAFAIIVPLMILLLGNLRLGLISMIPNFAPIILTLGFMGWSGMPLEMFTLLTGSIALGLAVDDTIHFMHNYRRAHEQGMDVHSAVRETLQTTGQALLFTSIVLSCGFFTYVLGDMQNLVYFGLVTGLTIILAFLADLILAPALIALLFDRPQRV